MSMQFVLQSTINLLHFIGTKCQYQINKHFTLIASLFTWLHAKKVWTNKKVYAPDKSEARFKL